MSKYGTAHPDKSPSWPITKKDDSRTFGSFAKSKSLEKKKAMAGKMSRADRVGSRKKDFTSMQKQGNWMKVHKLDK